MQAYRRSGSIAPLILNLGTRQKLPILIEEEAGWAPVAMDIVEKKLIPCPCWDLKTRNKH